MNKTTRSKKKDNFKSPKTASDKKYQKGKNQKKKKKQYTDEEILQFIRQMTIFDTDYMRFFFKDNTEIVQFVLRIIMHKPDLQVINMQVEHIMPNIHKRSLTIDVFAKDSSDVYYNFEVQKRNDGAHIRRARYHGSMMDMNVTPENTKWPDIPEIYIIFITENDVQGGGLPLYHIERSVQETGRFVDDGLHLIYVNGSYAGNDDLGRLMADFRQPDPDKMNYPILSDRTRQLKGYRKGDNDMSILREWIANMSKEEYLSYFADEIQEREQSARKTGFADGEASGRKAGFADGEKAGKMGMASNLLRMGVMSKEQISQASGLTIDEIDELSKQN